MLILKYYNTLVHLLSIIEFLAKPPKALAAGISDFNLSDLAVCEGDPVRQNANDKDRRESYGMKDGVCRLAARKEQL